MGPFRRGPPVRTGAVLSGLRGDGLALASRNLFARLMFASELVSFIGATKFGRRMLLI